VQFTDSMNRVWTLNPTVGQLKPLRELGLDLPKLLTEPDRMSDVLLADPEKLVTWLWLLCEKQADKAGITPEQFAAGFTAPVLERAARAVVLAAVFICRGPRVLRASRPKLEAALDAAFDPEAGATAGVAAAAAN
jgi:hypothetical protein